MFFDVFQESLNKGSADLGDAAAQPHIIVKEISLAREDSQVHSEVVVLTVDDRHQTLFHFLGDVQDTGEIHYSLVVTAKFTDRANH